MGVGAMRHAWSLGALIAVITQQPTSEAAQLADIIIAPQTGPEAVAGLANPKAQLAQRQIVNMLTTGLAIRDGRCTAICGWTCRLTIRTGRSGR